MDYNSYHKFVEELKVELEDNSIKREEILIDIENQ